MIQEFIVNRAGDLCDGKDCWKEKGNKGYGYKDKEASAAGVSKIEYLSGNPGKGSAKTKGKNDAKKGLTSLPTGVAAALSGNMSPTIQMLTSDGFCVSATLNEIKEDDPFRFRAQKR